MAEIVTLRNPEGELQAFNASDVPLLLKRQYTMPSNEEIQRHNDLIDAGGFVGGAKAFGEAALSAATFGASREAANALGITTPYEQAIRKEAHPLASGLGTAAGIIAPAIATMGATAPEAAAAAGAGAVAPSLLGQAGRVLAAPVEAVSGIGKAISKPVAGAVKAGLGGVAETSPLLTQALSRGAGGLAAGAAEGALYGLGNQIDEHALGDPEALGEHLAAGIGNGALWGSTISGGLGVVAPMAKKAMESLKEANVFKKGLSIISGVSEENIDAYMKNHEAINATPELKEFYDASLGHVQQIFDDVAADKLAASEAKDAFKALENNLSENLKQNKWEARQAITDAKMVLGTAFADKLSQLQGAGLEAAPKITQSVERLREHVVNQSQEAYKLLEASDKKIDLNSFIEKANDLIEKVKSESTLESEQAAKRLSDYVDYIKGKANKPFEAEGAAAEKLVKDNIIGDLQSIETQVGSLIYDNTGYGGGTYTRAPGYTIGLDYVTRAIKKFNSSKADMIKLSERLKSGEKLTAKQAEIYEYLKAGNKIEERAGPKDWDFGDAVDELQESQLKGEAPKMAKTFDGTIPAVSAKKMIQGLDKLSKYDFNASSFDKGMSLYYKQMRHVLDQELKNTVPAYRQAMLPLSEDTKLLAQLSKYGEDARAIRAINSIKTKANQLIEIPVLKQLEKRVGIKFMPEVEGMILAGDRKALEMSLPEYVDLAKAGKTLNHLKNPETERMFYAALEKTPEFQKLSEAQKRLADSELKKLSLDGLTPKNIETKLKAAMRGKFNVEEAIKQLPEVNGVPMEEALQNLKVKEAFEGGKAQGSRAVNMFGALGSAAGMMSGHLVGGIGAGAAIGAYMDKYGHQAAKSILDLTIGMSDRAKIMSNMMKQVEKNNQSIVSNAKDIFKGTAKAIPSALIKIGTTDIKPETFKQIDEVANNPEKLQQVLEANISGLDTHIPGISMNANITTIKAAKFLSGKVPHGSNRILSKPYKPSKSETMKFNRYYNTIQKPTSVLKKIKFGMVMPEDMEALKAVYPQMLSQMQGAVMEELADHMANAKDLPYQTKLGLSAFLEQDLVNSLGQQSVAMNQATFAAPSMQKDQGLKPTQGGLGKLTANDRFQTGFKKLSAGSEA
jgi:hypothetical protein